MNQQWQPSLLKVGDGYMVICYFIISIIVYVWNCQKETNFKMRSSLANDDLKIL